MTYGKILETISKLENVENIKKLIEKPRLSCFQEICDNKENTQIYYNYYIPIFKYN